MLMMLLILQQQKKILKNQGNENPTSEDIGMFLTHQ
jgi:hypothetical protein